MADISKEIESFRNAKYGEEVRGSMISLAEKVNGESEEAVRVSEENARTAGQAADDARKSEKAATEKAAEAGASAASIVGKVEESEASASDAAHSAELSEEYYLHAKSYAVGTEGEVRENDSTDNSRYYYEQAKRISEGLQGGLLPMGTVAFEELETVPVSAGYMYNISNEFTSDERFKDGGEINYGKGNNAYYTADGMWDVLAAPSLGGSGLEIYRSSTRTTGNSNAKELSIKYPVGCTRYNCRILSLVVANTNLDDKGTVLHCGCDDLGVYEAIMYNDKITVRYRKKEDGTRPGFGNSTDNVTTASAILLKLPDDIHDTNNTN